MDMPRAGTELTTLRSEDWRGRLLLFSFMRFLALSIISLKSSSSSRCPAFLFTPELVGFNSDRFPTSPIIWAIFCIFRSLYSLCCVLFLNLQESQFFHIDDGKPILQVRQI